MMSARWWLPPDAVAHGPALDYELHLSLWIAVGLFALAHLVLFLGLKRRRTTASRGAVRWELTTLALITLLFVWLTVRAEHLWKQTRYAGADPAAMQVEVVGEQFVWYFRYPGKDARFGRTQPDKVSAAAGNPLGLDDADEASKDDRVSSQLILPVGQEVDLRIRSLDVMHGFSVPELRIKQDAVPGQIFHLHFTPTQQGKYAVLCTQVCGLGHYRMQATVYVVSKQDYAAWLQGEAIR